MTEKPKPDNVAKPESLLAAPPAAGGDRVDDLAGVVETLLAVVQEQGVQIRDLRDSIQSREKRDESALEGFRRLGDKVGALASSMEKNIAFAREQRDRSLAEQRRVLEEIKGATPAPGRQETRNR